MTTNAVGNDEWVGVDDISVTGDTDRGSHANADAGVRRRLPTPDSQLRRPTPTPTPTRPTPSPTPTPAGIKISQVYGGGGNAGATLTNDFIELLQPDGRRRVALPAGRSSTALPTSTTWSGDALVRDDRGRRVLPRPGGRRAPAARCRCPIPMRPGRSR